MNLSPEERLQIAEQKINLLEHVASVQGGELEAFNTVIIAIAQLAGRTPEVRDRVNALLEERYAANLATSKNEDYNQGFYRAAEALREQMDFLLNKVD